MAGRACETLSVERIDARYIVAATHPDPQRVRARLDRCLEGHLAECLACAAARVLANEAGLWFVRRLPVELDLDAGLPADVLAQTLARAIVVALAREMREGNAANVIHFADRAGFLANLVIDCAQGEAWQRWYYRKEAGLRLLSTSSAIATALVADIDDGARALQRLAASDLKRVVAALSAADARRLLDAMAAPTPCMPDASIWRAALASWRSSRHASAACDEQRALLILAGMRLADPDAIGSPPVRDACRIAARTFAALHVLALQGGGEGRLAQPPGMARGHLVAIRALLPQDLRLEELATLLSAMAEQPAPAADAAVGHTAFGGLFLLLDALDACGLDGAGPFDRVLRLSVLARCLGRDRFLAALRDPLWRRLLGVDAALGASDIRACLGAAGGACRRRLERACLEPAFGSGEGAWQLAAALDAEVATWIVTDDRGLWSAVVTFDGPRHVSRLLRLVFRGWPAQRTLRAASAQARCLADALPGLSIEVCDDPPPGMPARDLEYLGVPTGGWDGLVTLLAARVLRRFAQRLPGFAASGFGYLYANCLDIDADIEWRDDRTVVHLARPPLNLILNLAGANRGERRINWLAGPPLALFPDR